MKRFLTAFFMPILTFSAGVYIYRHSAPKVSLETITEHTWFYDGMKVEIETYAQITSFDEDGWYIGEPFEKMEAITYLNLEENISNIEDLHSQLKENLSEKKFKRAKVLVRGTVKDNCKLDGIANCCFGRNLTMETREIIQLAPAEDYQMPE